MAKSIIGQRLANPPARQIALASPNKCDRRRRTYRLSDPRQWRRPFFRRLLTVRRVLFFQICRLNGLRRLETFCRVCFERSLFLGFYDLVLRVVYCFDKIKTVMKGYFMEK